MRELLEELDLEPQARFTHAKYEVAKTRLLDITQSLGYFDAEFDPHRVEVDLESNSVRIELRLRSGVRYRIGSIQVHQPDLRSRVFSHYLTAQEGELFDAAELRRTHRRLLESGYYDRVVVTPDIDGRSDGQVAVSIRAQATSRRTLLLGAGFATDTGPRVRADLRYRRVNDRGHRARISALASTVLSEVTGEYRLPYGDPTHEWLAFKASVGYEETDTSQSLRYGVGISRSHRRGRHWTETSYADYLIDDFEVGDQAGRSRLLLVGTGWTRTTTIDAPRPTRGRTINLDIRGASKAVLSDTDFVQIVFRGKQILPFGQRFRLIGRASGGWTWKEEFDDLPPAIRFFAGGDNSVRGYGFEELGPEENDEVIGGSKLLTGSLELDALVRPDWSVALFADAGSAFNDSPDFSRSVGLGVRWYSPLGPFRLDLAHPLDDPGHDFRIHVSLGPDL
jgi:translocation and assembly module TamA